VILIEEENKRPESQRNRNENGRQSKSENECVENDFFAFLEYRPKIRREKESYAAWGKQSQRPSQERSRQRYAEQKII
jgi:hypothetical protein